MLNRGKEEDWCPAKSASNEQGRTFWIKRKKKEIVVWMLDWEKAHDFQTSAHESAERK